MVGVMRNSAAEDTPYLAAELACAPPRAAQAARISILDKDNPLLLLRLSLLLRVNRPLREFDRGESLNWESWVGESLGWDSWMPT